MGKESTAWIPSNADIEQYELFGGMLRAQKGEFDLLSKKKADGQLNPMKIKMVNRVLEPLKNLLKHEESSIFLDILEEEDIPTNSDVVLIISQYQTALSNFRSEHYSGYEWKTVDNGYSFNSDDEDEEEGYEDDEEIKES